MNLWLALTLSVSRTRAAAPRRRTSKNEPVLWISESTVGASSSSVMF
jgi:hypothetical protein